MNHLVRVWDAPTRVFHWTLATCVIGLFITSRIGGAAMDWHFRLGYCVLALLLFRLIWGFAGGHWSRFRTFTYAPHQVLRYLQGRGDPEHSIGHTPTGALSVYALLGLLTLQVITGLSSDDEISAAGPLTRHVPGAIVDAATRYHTTLGQYGLMLLVALHLGAITFYFFRFEHNLVKPMLTGEKHLDAPATHSRDGLHDRVKALLIFAGCAASVAGLITWLS